MYDTNAQAIGLQLQATSAQFFSEETIESILSLISSPDSTTVVADNIDAANNSRITPNAGVDIAFIETSDTESTTVTVTGDTAAIFFQGAGGVNATIGTVLVPNELGNASEASVAGQEIERVVVGTAAADTITIADGKNTQVIAGDKDAINAVGTGHTLVVAAQGSSTVVGNDKTVVQVVGAEDDFTISTADGKATIANAATGVTVNLTGVNYVQLDDDDALIFADNEDQAAVANLYHAVLGRNADAGGLEFWYDRVDEGVSMHAIAQAFLDASEYTGGAQTNAQFLDTLYEDLLGRDADAAGTLYWTAQLSGGVSRADVLAAFAEVSLSDAEVDVVGTVTIIDPLA